ncbi:MAG: HEPN domain-containing protein [Sedimentisphaerales bacterium]|nr:HEPN domain-containing protein [Sedimentisphaerales bacterium]
MSEIINEWIRKADADYATASREMLACENANFDAVCFHSQQCIEKLIKALLIRHGVTPPKIHDLFQLNLLLMPVCKKWFCRPEDLRYLTRAAVDFRYPGESADRDEAAEALEICSKLCTTLHQLLAEQ